MFKVWGIKAYATEYSVPLADKFDEKYGEGFFDGNNAVGDLSFIFINSNPFLDVPGPKTPKMVRVSGIGIKDLKPLDEYWNRIL
uniref:5'-nucleotidase n=1 Tax=Strongyloides papillosus TaxID=174720 RepID=A0A0N5BMZ1_STREA